MCIDPAKAHRTRDGRAVRIYATDGGGGINVHGAVQHPAYGWLPESWFSNGRNSANIDEYDLIEVTLADELTEQIPWEAIRPCYKFVVGTPTRGDFVRWEAYKQEPNEVQGGWRSGLDGCIHPAPMKVIAMPNVPNHRWRETLCRRPEGR